MIVNKHQKWIHSHRKQIMSRATNIDAYKSILSWFRYIKKKKDWASHRNYFPKEDISRSIMICQFVENIATIVCRFLRQCFSLLAIFSNINFMVSASILLTINYGLFGFSNISFQIFYTYKNFQNLRCTFFTQSD